MEAPVSFSIDVHGVLSSVKAPHSLKSTCPPDRSRHPRRALWTCHLAATSSLLLKSVSKMHFGQHCDALERKPRCLGFDVALDHLPSITFIPFSHLSPHVVWSIWNTPCPVRGRSGAGITNLGQIPPLHVAHVSTSLLPFDPPRTAQYHVLYYFQETFVRLRGLPSSIGRHLAVRIFPEAPPPAPSRVSPPRKYFIDIVFVCAYMQMLARCIRRRLALRRDVSVYSRME